MKKIDDLFYVRRGKGDYLENLEIGKTPIISSTLKKNGVVGYVDLKPIFKAPNITVDRVTGQSFIQLSDFVTVPDDITVLIPRKKMSIEQLFYIASNINKCKWRFSYGRKLTGTRLKNIKIGFSLMPKYKIKFSKFIPKKQNKIRIDKDIKYKLFNITTLFKLKRGDFHALDRLDEGKIPTVSRVTFDNGIVGYYEPPNDAKIYSKLTITISTTSGIAFVQLDNFIATDNVVILQPKRKFKITTLFFIQYAINRTKWRYSYGRQCYKTKFATTNIFLPVTEKGDINEDHIEKVVKDSYGWGIIEKITN